MTSVKSRKSREVRGSHVKPDFPLLHETHFFFLRFVKAANTASPLPSKTSAAGSGMVLKLRLSNAKVETFGLKINTTRPIWVLLRLKSASVKEFVESVVTFMVPMGLSEP